MLALLSVWIGLAMFALAAAMLVVRSLFSDALAPVLLYGSVLGMTLGGIVLWAHRKEGAVDSGIIAQRTQAKVGIALSLVAAGMFYALVAAAQPVPLPQPNSTTMPAP